MKRDVVDALLKLNAGFYDCVAVSFSATRQRIQPGIARALSDWVGLSTPGSRLLDVGCGNGNLAAWLNGQEYPGWYVGVDQSVRLLAAHETLPERYAFQSADLSQPDWLADLPPQPFDRVVAFAVLHHLPGEALRVRLLREVKRLLAPDGRFEFSTWQLDRSPRLVGRLQPWSRLGLQDADVDPGDVLLDWRAADGVQDQTLRYIHIYNEEELSRLAGKSGFRVESTWRSDGQGGQLGLYQSWARS